MIDIMRHSMLRQGISVQGQIALEQANVALIVVDRKMTVKTNVNMFKKGLKTTMICRKCKIRIS